MSFFFLRSVANVATTWGVMGRVKWPIDGGATILDFKTHVWVYVRVLVAVSSWSQILNKLCVVYILWASGGRLRCRSTRARQIMECTLTVTALDALGLYANIIIFVVFVIVLFVSIVVNGTVASLGMMDRTFDLLDRGSFFSFFLRLLQKDRIDALHFNILVRLGNNALWI